MGKLFRLLSVLTLFCKAGYAQVDTTLIYNNSTPYGSLDIRIAKSASNYYHVVEDKTFSFRENGGAKTDTYLDMTSWDSSPYAQGYLTEKTSSGDLFVMNYRLLKPENYNPTYAPGYPLILIFHGLGERGNCWDNRCYHADGTWTPNTNTPAAPIDPTSELLNNDHQLTNSGNAHLRARNAAAGKLPNDPTLAANAFPGFVLQPQNLNGWNVSSVQDALRLTRLIAKKYNIDENRIYVHGLSNGGQGALEAIKRAPWMFAAGAMMSPIGDALINQQGVANTIAHIPMWIFQGGQDKNPYPQKTESMIRKFRDAGAVVRYTLYPELGHGTWASAYREPDFFSWFLGKNLTQLHLYAGEGVICGSVGVPLQLPAGYPAYQWQLNRQTIAEATSATYNATMAGKYRARFARIANPTEQQWQPWSQEVQVNAGQALPQAVIKQRGTLLLRDLNGANEAKLEAEGVYDRYEWFKNGSRVDFPGDDDDSLSTVAITSAMGAGQYTLVVSNFDGCSSAASAPKNIMFNDQAPVSITPPSGLTGTVNSGVEIALTWTDASSNETNFEIWRRMKLTSSSYSPWEFVTLAPANSTSYKDSGLLSSTSYEYKVRAVSSNARSVYAPAGANGFAITTTVDTQAPSIPTEINATQVGVSKVRVSWKPSTDNSGVKDYVIYFGQDSVVTTGSDTVFVITTIPVNGQYQLTVKARDNSGNLSDASEAVNINTYVTGLYYEHSTGSWTDLDSINWNYAEFTGRVQEFTLSPKTQEEFFNFKFDGFLFIEKEGNYEFRIGSNDGSRLVLSDELLIDNDGIHNFKVAASTPKAKTKGAHRITVYFFEYTGIDSLLVEYKGSDTNGQWTKIPKEKLKSAEQLVTAIGPDNGPEDSFKVDIYPNPTSQDNIHLAVTTVIDDPISIQLIDPIGRSLVHRILDKTEAEDVRLETQATLTPGVYFIEVIQRDAAVRQRVVIK
ncbi:MAG TPA: prolyl oligopeptidase family serine peptidase [Chryseosolibacter sp.]